MVASLAVLGADLLLYGGFLFHTLRVRDRLERLAEKLVPGQTPPAAAAYLDLPAPVLMAGVLLFMVLLLLKEVAIERRSRTLKLNLLAFVVGVALFAGFLVWVQGDLEGTRLR